MVPCPEELPTWSGTVPREEFEAATSEEQVNLIINYAAKHYGREYHSCAIRQRTLVKHYESVR